MTEKQKWKEINKLYFASVDGTRHTNSNDGKMSVRSFAVMFVKCTKHFLHSALANYGQFKGS